MFAEVILHRRVPSRFESFTYKIPDGMNLKKGQIVRVPFRNQTLSAIVKNIHNTTPKYPTKDIAEAMPDGLTENQSALADWMSEFYKCPYSKVIDFFIPEKIWQPSKRNIFIARRTPEQTLQSAPKQSSLLDCFAPEVARNDISALTKQIISSTSPCLIFEKTPLPRKELFQQLSNELPKDSQALFLFPDLFTLNTFAKDIPVYHSELKESEKAQIWTEVKSGKIKTIAGTRGALFLPFKNLTLITVDSEHSESYSEIRQPNYDALKVAEKMASLKKIPLVAISQSPRVETWYKAKIAKYLKIDWTQDANNTSIGIIDMANERRKGIFGHLAQATTEKMASLLVQNKQILLFINRKGESSALLCQDCNSVARCETCNSPLSIHKENDLRCHKCNKKTNMIVTCKGCGGSRLKAIGTGTEKLEKEINKIFSKANILRLDKDKKSASFVFDELGLKTLSGADIIIATQIIDKPLELRRLALTVVVQMDSMLHFPTFRANERVFQLLTRLRTLTHGELLIQTFLPDQNIFQTFSRNLAESFYEEELETRKSLQLPPFSISTEAEEIAG